MTEEIANIIYNDIFLYIQHTNIDIFLCGGASDREHRSTRDLLRERLEKWDNISVFYPEDLFMELMNRKKYNMLKLEAFLADNSDLIAIVCESSGSYTELGAFISNRRTLSKMLALVPTKIKKQKSFLMLGAIPYLEASNRNFSRVIYYNSNLDELEDKIGDFIDSWYPQTSKKKLHKQKCNSWYSVISKDLNLISGQVYFILLLLYFEEYIESNELLQLVKSIYLSREYKEKDFEIISTAATQRLYKIGLLTSEKINGKDVFLLTQSGYQTAKEILQKTEIENRSHVINGIRMKIMNSKYC